MTFPFERTPTGAEGYRLHRFASPAGDAPLRRPTATEINETGALVFSMLTLEAEDRS